MAVFAETSWQQRVIGNKIVHQKYNPATDPEHAGAGTWQRRGGDSPTEDVLVLLQPDEKLDLGKDTCSTHSYIRMFKKTEEIIDVLKTRSAEDLEDYMNLGRKMAASHLDRFKTFEKLPPKQAALIFGGKRLRAADWEDKEKKFNEKRVRLISGLYGVLRPFDDVKPVRDLPFTAKLAIGKNKSVLEYWGDSITKQLGKDIQEAGLPKTLVVGCMSEEYWRAVQPEHLPDHRCVQVAFQGAKPEYTTAGRTKMANYILKQRVCTSDELREFDDDDWELDSKKSTNKLVVYRWRGEVEGAAKDKKKKKDKSASPEADKRSSKKRNKSPSASGSPTRHNWKVKKKKKNGSDDDDGGDCSDSSELLVAPKKRNDRDVRESSRSPARKAKKDSKKEDADDSEPEASSRKKSKKASKKEEVREDSDEEPASRKKSKKDAKKEETRDESDEESADRRKGKKSKSEPQKKEARSKRERERRRRRSDSR
eukprot:TRINITY_DN33888_c0_g1_i1.p1 TRINITY_DN33888_c0_g1~~TRINITY_DN33888_c0_g1_i1.p1  ORF type:complete len:481 (+),score=157.41 TRINITY_DN33888_c0_g1_i1:77-1519(+)